MLKAVWKRCVLRCRLNVGKVFKVKNGILKEIRNSWCIEGTRIENKFRSRTVRRLAEVEQTSLDRAYGNRRLDKYD